MQLRPRLDVISKNDGVASCNFFGRNFSEERFGERAGGTIFLLDAPSLSLSLSLLHVYVSVLYCRLAVSGKSLGRGGGEEGLITGKLFALEKLLFVAVIR